FYVKNAHRGVIPGLNEFLAAYASQDAMGAGGYLSERGLVVLDDAKLKEVQDALTNAVNMAPPAK
ncbi:MAG: phosphate ABC transporter substrate-binding protein, partial [Tabrizicola sp.]|nr:phosphate ABC transporter substrate-binding protein [Tabrizicola sp.]